ncbi:MAG TPA: hypothetical protein VJT73_21285 [Polyangiaceae bacterium]|nr:hypothetical protein [Polyangiaceae bacterium]
MRAFTVRVAVSLGWAVTTVALSGCQAAEKQAEAAPAPVVLAPPRAPTPEETITSKTTLSDALAIAKPLMIDVPDQESRGTRLLGQWANERMAWSDAKPARDETSVTLVRRKRDTERGKRMCQLGKIIQLEHFGDAKNAHGILMTPADELVSFLAVGSTGNLSPHRFAQFCGVVTGLQTYTNRGGSLSRAVQLVGMFDLPENRSANRAR